MTISVTGASGQLGRLVVDQLLVTQPPHSIVALVRDEGKASQLPAGVQVRVADYGDPLALKAALRGVERLLLISGSEVGRRIQQHRNVIDAAMAADVAQIAYTSMLQADTTALILAPEHKATEEYLRGAPISSTILRHGWYTENYHPQLEIARQTGAIVAAAGSGRVASATRADFAAAAAVVMTTEGHEGAIYELAGDQAWDYPELAATIAQLIGRPVEYRPLSVSELVEHLVDLGTPRDAAAVAAALDANIAEGLLAGTSHDLSRLIGRPTTSLYDGLAAGLPA